jgi:uncharacterized membrane protein
MERRRHNKNHRTFRPAQNRENFESSNPSYGILPAPGILESYEEIAEGSVAKIIDMAKLEQEHRHKWEMNYLRVMAYNQRVGQLLAFIMAIVVIFTSMSFVMSGEFAFALVIAVLGFAFLITLVYSVSSNKRYVNKPNMNQHNNRDTKPKSR